MIRRDHESVGPWKESKERTLRGIEGWQEIYDVPLLYSKAVPSSGNMDPYIKQQSAFQVLTAEGHMTCARPSHEVNRDPISAYRSAHHW